MDRKELNRRFETAVLKAYNESENIFDRIIHFDSYQEFIDVCPVVNGRKRVPYKAFFLNPDRYEQIDEELTKNIRKYWTYPYKIQFVEDGKDLRWESYRKDIEEYENVKKELSPYKRKKRMLEIAKKHNLQYRSRLAENMHFEFWNIGPTTHKNHFEKFKEEYIKENNKEFIQDVDILTSKLFIEEYDKHHKE